MEQKKNNVEGAIVFVKGPRHHYRQTYNKLRKSKAFKSEGLYAKNRRIYVPLDHTNNAEIMINVLAEVLNSFEVEYELEKY